MSQTAEGHSLGENCHAPPGDSVASTGSSEAGSSYRPAAGTISTSSVRKFYGLKYYKELNGDRDGGSQSLNDMDLGQLRRLAANEEDGKRDIEQTKSIAHVYYSIFLKTGALEDLERSLDRAKEQMLVKVDNPQYAPRLKDLIVMLFKKYQHTNLLDDLQEAIFRAQEMMTSTPLDHPDRSARIGDCINMMFMKFDRTGSQDDLDEAIIIAQEAGTAVSVDILDSEGTMRMKVGIPM
jgi:hypothetical protein